jgi:lipopolysaccharide transport system ATP-binding protein
MAKDLAISLRGVSKSYSIAHNGQHRTTTFREMVVDRLRHPLRRPPGETFWALKDVSFDVEKGDVIGIIGRNGAGKSTLLKILSRITRPTAGEIDVYGRIGSLLEVGTGFHPELTGRENIFLNGAILGMTRAEIRRQFDEIVAFADVERFLDTPVKRYSSGMYVRLAFAVAAHLNPEILIVDEVLAVGDSQFQRKCLGKMQSVARSGRTILFVSHNMAVIQRICSRALLIERGMLADAGPASETVLAYLTSENRHRSPQPSRETHALDKAACIESWGLTKSNAEDEFATHHVRSGQDAAIRLVVRFHQPAFQVHYGLAIWSEDGILVWAGTSLFADQSCETVVSGRYDVTFRIRGLSLRPGRYRIDASVNSSEGQLDRWQADPELNVLPRRADVVPPAWQGIADFDHTCVVTPSLGSPREPEPAAEAVCGS